MTQPLVPFLYGYLLKTRRGTRLEQPPRDLGKYLAFSVQRAAEAVLGLWTRAELRQRLGGVLENLGNLRGVEHLSHWYTQRGDRLGVTALDEAVRPRGIRDRSKTRNLTRMAAYNPDEERYRASFSHNKQLTMGVKGRKRGNYRNEPPIREGSVYHPFFMPNSLTVHPHAGFGSCCLDSGEHRLKIRDYEVEVACYHHFVRFLRAALESAGLAQGSISDLPRGRKVIMPFDFSQAPELVFEAFTRKFVDRQPLWQISFELADFYERILTPEGKRLLKKGRGYFGLIPLTRRFSEVADEIKEVAIRALWRGEDSNVRYDFLGHGVEKDHLDTRGLFGEGYRKSFIFVRREPRAVSKRKRVHLVFNPETELAYYVFKIPIRRRDELLQVRPLIAYEEECPAFRDRFFCAVYQPRDRDLGPRLAAMYNRPE